MTAIVGSLWAGSALGVPLPARGRQEGPTIAQRVEQDEQVVEGMRALQAQMMARVQAVIDAARSERLVLIASPGDPEAILAAADAQTEKVTYLGVATERVSAVLAEQLKLPHGVGLVVGFVEKGSPAEAAGLKVHDIVEKFEDQWVIDQEQFTVLVRMKKPADEATLTVVREGQRLPIKVTLSEKEVPLTVGMQAMPNVGGGGGLGVFGPEEFQLIPGAGAPGWHFQSSSTHVQTDGTMSKKLDDDQGEVAISRGKEGETTVVVKDRSGKELYSGPYDTAEDKAKVPGDLAARVRRLDEGVTMSNGAAGGAGKAVAKSAVMTRTDNEHALALRVVNGSQRLTVKDLQSGTTLFDGPVDTAEERQSLPAEILPKLEAMERKLGG